jgi:hypothetical protein
MADLSINSAEYIGDLSFFEDADATFRVADLVAGGGEKRVQFN